MKKPLNWTAPDHADLARYRIDGRVEVLVEYIGEGYGGDYDEDDEEDEPLVRITATDLVPAEQRRDDQDNSFCTNVPAYAPQATLNEFAKRVAVDLQDAPHWKRVLGRWTWAGVDDQGNLTVPEESP